MNVLRPISTLLLAASAFAAMAANPGAGRADDGDTGERLPELRFQPEDEDLSGFTNRQLADKGQKLVARMDKQLTESFYLLEASLSAGDIAAASARNEAITVMKGLVKLAEGNLRTLKQRVAEDDRPRVENEYVKITIAASKVQEYYAQVRSAASVGLDAFELSNVERRLTFSGRLPVVEELPRLFSSDYYTPFASSPSAPFNASPWF